MALRDEELRHLMSLHPAIWAQFSGIKTDGRPFTWDGHKYLYPLYCDRSLDIRVMKSAQMGATIWMALRAFHQALFYSSWGYKVPARIGFYFPDQPGLNMMVKSRIEPMMQTCDDLLPYSKAKTRAYKPIDESALYFFYIKGKSAKDSMPLMSLFFDEVRLVDLNDVDQVYERLSASPIPYKVHVSTAGFPESDIHHLFLDSDQKWWHTICEKCGHDQVLPLEFPECIAEHTIGPRAGEVYYICRKCRGEIRDTQHGLYVPHGDANHENSGYQFSQLISSSPTCHPRRILRSYRMATNKKEWVNGKLGIPFVDASNRPITEDLLPKNVNPILQWGDLSGVNFMGVDQRLRENYVVILNRPSGSEKRRIVHLEIIEDEDPWRRTSQLMEEFSVKVCVCDAEPNANEAMRFAQDFPRRVFLAKRGMFDDLIRWGDQRRTKVPFRKAEKDSFYQYRVFLDKYQDIERTLNWLLEQRIEWPDPCSLIQTVTPLGGGRATASPILESHFYRHFCSAVREQKVLDEHAKKYRWEWRFIGGDPHGLDALCYARAASERRMPQGLLSF